MGKLYLPVAAADPVPWIDSLGGSEVEEDAVIAAWHREEGESAMVGDSKLTKVLSPIAL